MRVVIQRVTESSVLIDSKIVAEIGNGLLILLGIEEADGEDDIDWLCGKIARLRIFNDDQMVMNLAVTDVNADVLIVSQFTLHASTRKGNRPSYIRAVRPEVAIPLYETFKTKLSEMLGKSVHSGEFGAMMQIHLVNDGPVTIIIDSKVKE
ncbi:MAG: D-tyrosyl-tRNA(Tyr) deacylase [Bacteroidales bacterium]|nr:D-tyrosyl-tRNA(Tyr) deacylase [Bacteroidales bacterium]